MLTDVQKGMIRIRLLERLEKLIYYYQNVQHDEQACEKVKRHFQNALTEGDGVYGAISYPISSNKTSLRHAIPIIEYEIWGIYNSNYKVLNDLFIINNVRDTVQVTKETLLEMSQEIKMCVMDALESMKNIAQFSTYLEINLCTARPATILSCGN